MVDKKSTQKACVEHLKGKSSRIVLEGECFTPAAGKSPVFFVGFTGTGMVGSIVANELIDQLETKQMGYVLSEELSPITIFYDGILKHPFRLYYTEKYNAIISICEVPFLPGSYTDLSRTLMDWALSIGVHEVICIQGLSDNSYMFHEGPYPVYVAGEQELITKLKSFDIKSPPKGLIMGAEAAILNECMNNKLIGGIYLTPANPQIPCPEGASAILNTFAKVYKFPIKTDKLLEEAQEIKQSLMELTEKTNKMHNQPMPEGTGGRDRYIYS